MAYQIVDGSPAAMGGNNSLGLLEARKLGKAPPSRLLFKFELDHCPKPFNSALGHTILHNGILDAIKLATKATDALDALKKKPPHKIKVAIEMANTVAGFTTAFGEGPGAKWKLPWAPKQTMPAGDIVAKRFRTVAKELQTRDTEYKCVHCMPRPVMEVPEPPSHPTETIVRDTLAMAVLCENEVRLCPQFWQVTPEERAATVLHEMFHLCFGLTCAWFQHDPKERKRNNAYCYEAFALLVAGVTPPPTTTDKCTKTPVR